MISLGKNLERADLQWLQSLKLVIWGLSIVMGVPVFQETPKKYVIFHRKQKKYKMVIYNGDNIRGIGFLDNTLWSSNMVCWKSPFIDVFYPLKISETSIYKGCSIGMLDFGNVFSLGYSWDKLQQFSNMI